MVTHFITCGDSFGCGVGLESGTCFEKSFAGVASQYFNIPQLVYARSGCCNFAIYLQVKKVIEHFKDHDSIKPFVLITTTFHERLTIPLDDGVKLTVPDISCIDYSSYFPYDKEHSDKHREILVGQRQTRLLSETISNLEVFLSDKKQVYFKKLFKELSIEKVDAVKYYITELFDSGIKQQYDNAIIVLMHFLLKKNNIPHVIMGYNLHDLDGVDEYMENNWGQLSKKYPDPYGSGHCDEVGNKIVGEALINHIERKKII